MSTVDTREVEIDTAKRRQILEGARRCFLSQGFDGASMNDIVRVAGVSKGTVYSYFSSKQKLFAALIWEDRRHQAEALFVFDDSRPIGDVLREIGVGLLNLMKASDSIELARTVIASAPKFPELGRAFYEAGPAYGIAKVAEYLKRKMDDGTLTRRDPRHAAAQFIELVQAGFTKPLLFCLEERWRITDLEAHVESAVSLYLNGMRAR